MKKTSKRFLLIFFILILIISLIVTGAILTSRYLSNNEYLFKDNVYVPTSKRESYVLKTVDETLISNYVSKKQNTLVVFFASWCHSCVEESNDLTNFITNNPDIPVLVVSFDKKLEDLENYLSNLNPNWFVIFDKDRIIRKSLDTDTKGIPAVYLVDSNLNVIDKKIASMKEEDFFNFYFQKD